MFPWYIYAIGAMVFHSAFAIFRKKALLREHALNFESARTLILALLVLILIPFIDFNFDRNILILVYLVSLIGTAGILLTAKAFRHEEISLLSPLSNIRPAFVAILAYFFLSELLGTKEILGIMIIFVSAYMLEVNYYTHNLIDPIKNLFKSRYSIYLLFAIFLFSIASILDKFIISNYLDIYSYFFLIWIFIALNFNLIHCFMYGFKDVVKCFRKLGYLPWIIAIFSMASNLLALKALSLAYVSLVIPVIMVSSLVIVFFGGRFFHEKHILFRLAISAFMLIGALLVIL